MTPRPAPSVLVTALQTLEHSIYNVLLHLLSLRTFNTIQGISTRRGHPRRDQHAKHFRRSATGVQQLPVSSLLKPTHLSHPAHAKRLLHRKLHPCCAAGNLPPPRSIFRPLVSESRRTHARYSGARRVRVYCPLTTAAGGKIVRRGGEVHKAGGGENGSQSLRSSFPPSTAS